MKPIIVTILRAIQAFVAVVVLGMSAYVAIWYNTQTLTTAPTQVNFMMFVPVFTLLAIIYLEVVPRFAPRGSHPWVAVAFEITTTICWFAGFVALAVFLNELLFCRGPVCAAAKATAGAGGLEFFLWILTAILTAKDVFKLGFRRPTARRPAMKETV